MQADVKESFELSTAATQLLRVHTETNSACRETVNEAEQLLQETQQEEQKSSQMLNTAREVEEAAHAAMIAAEAVLLAAEARLAAALAAEATAVASMNPAAIASATAEVFSAQQAYQQAREAYELAQKAYEAAKAHRELLEKRYEMAKQALNLARLMKNKLETQCLKCITQITSLVEQGVSRLTHAHEDLDKYHSERTSVDLQVKAFNTWRNYQPRIGEPVKPEELHARLNPSRAIMQGLLKERYRTDPKFRAQVDSYREQAKTDRAAAEIKIKRNMVGNFAEEIVKDALKPYGGVHSEQERVYLPDGTYTKPDFVLRDLKTPLILGRGKGMGVRENGSIAVEVKTGQSNYILSQNEHLRVQAQGHAAQDASWVICTRDIREIEERKQRELRTNVKDAGSPIVGCLPYKSELDAACINFVFGDNNHD